MIRKPLLLPGILLCLPAFGADVLECVNPDVRKGLLGNASFSDEMPRRIEALPRPDGLTWIAGAFGTSAVTGAFRSDSEPQAAVDTAVARLTEDGWTPALPLAPPGAFADAGLGLEPSQTVCKEGDAQTITARPIEGVTYLIYSLSVNSERGLCATAGLSAGRGGPAIAGGIPMPQAVAALLPAFEYTTLDPAAVVGRRSGGADLIWFRRESEVQVDAEIGALADHLAQQLETQGWEPDGNWSGSALAGSSWTRPSPAGTVVALQLDVIDRGGSSFAVNLKMTELR